MQININGEIKTLDTEHITLSNLLLNENLSTSSGIALAVNFIVIPKKEWPNFTLKDNDQVTIIKAVQGG